MSFMMSGIGAAVGVGVGLAVGGGAAFGMQKVLSEAGRDFKDGAQIMMGPFMTVSGIAGLAMITGGIGDLVAYRGATLSGFGAGGTAGAGVGLIAGSILGYALLSSKSGPAS